MLYVGTRVPWELHAAKRRKALNYDVALTKDQYSMFLERYDTERFGPGYMGVLIDEQSFDEESVKSMLTFALRKQLAQPVVVLLDTGTSDVQSARQLQYLARGAAFCVSSTVEYEELYRMLEMRVFTSREREHVDTLELGGVQLIVDVERRRFEIDGEAVEPWPKSWLLFSALYARRNKLVTADHLVELCDFTNDTDLRSHIFRLRKELGKAKNMLRTRRSVGYGLFATTTPG